MSKPEVGIVVRAYNEQENLASTLRSLKNQKDINLSASEVIIVDNASTDRTPEVARAFLENNPEFPGQIVCESEKGRGKALHKGVLEAKADLIAFLDADSEAAANWLASIVVFMKMHPEIVAGSGHVEFRNGPWHHRFLYPLVRDFVYFIAARFNQGWISGANWWARKDAYHRTGGILNLPEETVNDDKIMAIRLRKEGKIVYLKEARVRTDNWLVLKPTWLTNLPREFEQVRQAVGVTKSLLHRLTEKTSFILSYWDRAKERMGLL
ncbi:MAG: family 2 glycosyl transferase [Microgenomates group bacterium LiPW_16]|nr:MAG: family 2 glycosyl transferase [Microgenomates group bacterium LiPW_16]